MSTDLLSPRPATLPAQTPQTQAPRLSVVIPVYNEEESLPALFARLYPALDALRIRYECVFVDDGSRDRSVAMLRAQFEVRPAETRIVLLQRNFGQHAAILAGFAAARGAATVTLDADLQNPPEEIAKLLAELDAGHDYVGTYRADRQDSFWRRAISRVINTIRERTTRISMRDHGCMMRAYDAALVRILADSKEVKTFIPALAALYARRPVEIEVAHEERAGGKSKYSAFALMRLNFDLMTGFSVVPLQLFSTAGFLVSALSGVLVLYLVGRRLILGPEVEGIFTLFAIAFFLIGVALLGIGLLGEYVGRIYEQVRQRPRFVVQTIIERTPPG
jgi:undecaprenyl-phosphate 4-deoxy-4-formamido-L-arabinose transferase